MNEEENEVLAALRTEAVEDFLKAVYKLERKQSPVPTTLLATTLGIKPPSVTEMAQKLANHGLLKYERYRGIRLTAPGRRIALEVIRHHRLIEMYLIEALGYSWDEVHDEADRLEHVISEQFEARIAAALGHPEHDPHGDPIPTVDGDVSYISSMTLAEAQLDTAHIVQRITNQSPDMLRYLASIGLIPGAPVSVSFREELDGPIHIVLAKRPAVISYEIAQQILLTPE